MKEISVIELKAELLMVRTVLTSLISYMERSGIITKDERNDIIDRAKINALHEALQYDDTKKGDC